MFAIGEFARHGRVSVRMLRHYDAIGLLRPAHVDPATGYRSYTAGQLADLNRIVALKDLGFSLEQVRTMIVDKISPAELRALLTIRRAELESTVAESHARLAQVESRLRGIEGDLPAADVVIKELPAVRLVGLTPRRRVSRLRTSRRSSIRSVPNSAAASLAPPFAHPAA